MKVSRLLALTSLFHPPFPTFPNSVCFILSPFSPSSNLLFFLLLRIFFYIQPRSILRPSRGTLTVTSSLFLLIFSSSMSSSSYFSFNFRLLTVFLVLLIFFLLILFFFFFFLSSSSIPLGSCCPPGEAKRLIEVAIEVMVDGQLVGDLRPFTPIDDTYKIAVGGTRTDDIEFTFYSSYYARKIARLLPTKSTPFVNPQPTMLSLHFGLHLSGECREGLRFIGCFWGWHRRGLYAKLL